ncbi:hypothetical protein SAMD00024442_10_29 [Candidatus Symbiothrix dinenymphae]|nr:hypothetical protein SAMD00024442_10_29 [Candidatus Symbiothrix dinenymphae]
MPNEQQEIIKQNAYVESMRYMSNAKETLQRARKENNRYEDQKYVRTACGTAYNGVLLALDAYLQLKAVEMPTKKRRSIEFYTANVGMLDGKLLKELNDAYQILHLYGYYDGIQVASVVKAGFDVAFRIIERIKPEHVPEAPVRSAKSSLLKQMMSLFI